MILLYTAFLSPHRFKCECLKVAVLKNKSLAQHLGGENWDFLLCPGDMFSVVFKYEVPNKEKEEGGETE